MTVRCFLIEPTDDMRHYLRRYTRRSDAPRATGGWTCEQGWHEARALVGTVPAERDEDGYVSGDLTPTTGHDDRRWPQECDKGCGYHFTENDQWQDFLDHIYRRVDTGELTTIRDAPDGAMWDAWWYPWKGPDGKCIGVRCPGGGEWIIDSVASNCTIHPATGPRTILPYNPDPNSAPEAHRCWIRHGEPPNLTVDKNGHTCAAGAGSILAGDYHGFLRDGTFT